MRYQIKMKLEVDTSKVLTWCKNNAKTVGWFGGSAVISLGVELLCLALFVELILLLGICSMAGIIATALFDD